MLPSVNYQVLVVRRIERRRDGRQFDELRACPDDADDLQGTTFHFVRTATWAGRSLAVRPAVGLSIGVTMSARVSRPRSSCLCGGECRNVSAKCQRPLSDGPRA